MSYGRPVEVKGVDMPMIDDHVEEVNGLQVATPLQKPRPKTVSEAITGLKTAKDASETWTASKLLCGLICSKTLVIVFFAITSFIHIFALFLGAIHFGDCPLDRRIPVYLIIAAIVGLGRALLNWYYRWHQKEDLEKPTCASSFNNLFWMAWLISGAAFCFGKEPNFDDPSSTRYCHKLTYYTAFAYTVLGLIVLLVSLLIGGAIGGYMTWKYCVDKARRSQRAAKAANAGRRKSGIV